MSVEQRTTTCWYFPSDAWEEPHFASRDEAQAQEDRWAADDERPAQTPQECDQPCWRVFCDVCGEEFEDDDFGSLHHATQADADAFAQAEGAADGDRRLCLACAEDAGLRRPLQMDPTIPLDLAAAPASPAPDTEETRRG